MSKLLKNFLKNEVGAVTADWVVLTALVGCLICAAYIGIEGGVTDLSGDLQDHLLGVTVGG